MLRVADLMTPDPVSVGPELAAAAALDLMIDQGIRHLPVVDRRDRVRGVVSLDDLRAAFPFAVSLHRPPSLSERESALGCSIGEVMTHGPLTALANTPLTEAAELLVRFRIGCLPVVDARGRLIGMFSEIDALQALVDGAPGQKKAQSSRILDLELLAAELRAEHARIAKYLERLQASERALATAPQNAPVDRAERACQLEELAIDEPLAALATSRLAGLERALARADRGRLGVCEACGQEIPVARMRALPGATQCVRCASSAERAALAAR